MNKKLHKINRRKTSIVYLNTHHGKLDEVSVYTNISGKIAESIIKSKSTYNRRPPPIKYRFIILEVINQMEATRDVYMAPSEGIYNYYVILG